MDGNKGRSRGNKRNCGYQGGYDNGYDSGYLNGYQRQTISGSGGLQGYDMHYVPYRTNPECNYVVLSDRAAKAIISETLAHGRNETGGILLGNFNNGIWYVAESIDPGLDTVNHSVNFEYDPTYVNHLAKKLGVLYHHPLTILGVWHRHPGGMDTFSMTDLESMAHMTNNARIGLLSMLVNLDPELRMTFYYCNKSGEVMPVYYDIGDDYFVPEILAYASNEEICGRIGSGFTRIKPHQTFPPEVIGGSIANLRAAAYQNAAAQAADAVPSAEERVAKPPQPEPEVPAAEVSADLSMEEPETVPAEAPAAAAAETPAETPAEEAPAEEPAPQPEQPAEAEPADAPEAQPEEAAETEPADAQPETPAAAPGTIAQGKWMNFVVTTDAPPEPEAPEAAEPEAPESAPAEAEAEAPAGESAEPAPAAEPDPMPDDEDSEDKDVPRDSALPDNWRYTNIHSGSECIHAVFSDRAYRAMVSEVAQWSPLETGGMLLGHLHNRIWYITECIHAGPNALRHRHTFELEVDYVNYQVETLSKLYQYPPTILGQWHRHPGSLDRFSYTDIASIDALCKDSQFGILSMLVNLDPDLRLTMYHCTHGKEMYHVPVSIGDAYMPVELLKMREMDSMTFPDGTPVPIRKEAVFDTALFPHSLTPTE